MEEAVTAEMSAAGHDGQAMAHLTEIGMIFARCRASISHNPLPLSPCGRGPFLLTSIGELGETG
jgi:hypothetical protein